MHFRRLSLVVVALTLLPSAVAAQPPPFLLKWGSLGSGDGQFGFPMGVAVGAGGNIYVGGQQDRVQVFTNNGTFLMKWGTFGTGDGQFNRVQALAVDGSGNVFVADNQNHRIQVFTSNGTFVTKWGSFGSGDGQFTYPNTVAVSQTGEVYVTETGVNQRVQVFTSTGTFLRKWGSRGNGEGQFNQPSGVVVDADGSVYVADQVNHRIQVFTSDGTFVTTWGTFGTGDGQFKNPVGLALDAAGNLYVTDAANDRIQVFTSTGTFVTKWGSGGTGDGRFNNPLGVAVDEVDNVYVVDNHNHRIQKFGVDPPCIAIDAIDDQFSVINDGTTAGFSVLANDECSDDPPISVVELPGDLLPDRGGSATIDGAKVDYTPAAGFVGFEEFTYTAQDAGLNGGDDPPAVDQDTAAVVVDVLENLIPDAVDDVTTTLQDQAAIIDVLANDTPGNLPNGVAIETEPANGTATPQTDNTINYSPNSDFFGEDSFEYRLTDANGDSDVATVTVGVFFVRGQVPIDIMPNSDGNDLNLRTGQGAGIDIAILSIGEFFEAPNEIDPLTLKFGPREGNIWGSPRVRDVDADGDEDLVVKFLIQQTGIPCGDTHAILFGRTFDFQSISGRDTINTFNCPRVRKRH
jgi:hypothetical protein